MSDNKSDAWQIAMNKWTHQQKRIDGLEAQLAIAVEALETCKFEPRNNMAMSGDEYYFNTKKVNEALSTIRKIGE